MSEKKKILAFGASLTAGFHNGGRGEHPYSIRLQALIDASPTPNYTMVTFGIPGEESGALISYLETLLNEKGAQYSHVIILAGTNDLAKRSYEEIFTNLKKMYNLVKEHGALPVCVTLPSSMFTNKSYVANREKVNEMIRDHSKSNGIPLVDLFELLPYSLKGDILHTKKYWDDGLHFTPAGYDKFGEYVFEAIKGVL